jgi:hypothetical protein
MRARLIDPILILDDRLSYLEVQLSSVQDRVEHLERQDKRRQSATKGLKKSIRQQGSIIVTKKPKRHTRRLRKIRLQIRRLDKPMLQHRDGNVIKRRSARIAVQSGVIMMVGFFMILALSTVAYSGSDRDSFQTTVHVSIHKTAIPATPSPGIESSPILYWLLTRFGRGSSLLSYIHPPGSMEGELGGAIGETAPYLMWILGGLLLQYCGRTSGKILSHVM